MEVSDYRLNASVRSILFRHWIDLQRLSFGSFRGTIRVKGELSFLGSNASANLGQLETIESEIRSIRGVKRVCFELSNWSRSDHGKWTCSDKRSRATAPIAGQGPGMTLEVVQRASPDGEKKAGRGP